MTIQTKNDEINNLKYEIFEKDQSIQIMNTLCHDLSQQIQFLYKKDSFKKYDKKQTEFRVNSIRSTKSQLSSNNGAINNGTTSIVYHHSNNSDFDIFNDLLLSPKKYINNKSSNVSTPKYSFFGSKDMES